MSGADPATREERRRRARPDPPPPPPPHRDRGRRRGGARAGLRPVVRAGVARHRLGRDLGWSCRSRAGESVSAVAGQLAAHHVIGSSLAFRIYDLVHGSPTIDPGVYLLHQNQSFSQVHAILGGGPNIFTVTVLRGLTLREVADPGGRSTRPRRQLVRPRGGQRRRPLGLLAARIEQPGGDARHRDLPGLPGRERHHHPHRHGATLRRPGHRGRVEHQLRRGARPDSLPGDHRRLHRGEGGLHLREHARRGPGHLQPAGHGHAAADELHRALLPGAGRGHGDVQGPRPADALQHLPQRRADPDAHLHPVPAGAQRRRCIRRPDRGSTSCW